ncbi:hypothetical protein ES702_04537 [subsurface metagenome]
MLQVDEVECRARHIGKSIGQRYVYHLTEHAGLIVLAAVLANLLLRTGKHDWPIYPWNLRHKHIGSANVAGDFAAITAKNRQYWSSRAWHGFRLIIAEHQSPLFDIELQGAITSRRIPHPRHLYNPASTTRPNNKQPQYKPP